MDGGVIIWEEWVEEYNISWISGSASTIKISLRFYIFVKKMQNLFKFPYYMSLKFLKLKLHQN